MADATEDQVRIIRVLIPDTEAVFGADENATMFSDEELKDFFTAGRGSMLRAAGYANYAIATSEALISKVIKTQDLSTNGAQVAEALIKKGNALFDQADKEDAADAQGYFEIVDYREGWGYDRAELTEWGRSPF